MEQTALAGSETTQTAPADCGPDGRPPSGLLALLDDVSEIVDSVRTHDLELIFLAEPCGAPSLNGFQAIDLTGGERPVVRPAILDQIAGDAASAWCRTPRWLGNLKRSALSAEWESRRR